MELTADLFAKRTYGPDAEATDLTDHDLKVLQSINKFQTAQKNALAKRKCIVFLEEPPKPQAKLPTESGVTQMCKATKMNGEPCKAKAKPGKCFCGRHLKLEIV